jgi:hypothetical protein
MYVCIICVEDQITTKINSKKDFLLSSSIVLWLLELFSRLYVKLRPHLHRPIILIKAEILSVITLGIQKFWSLCFLPVNFFLPSCSKNHIHALVCAVSVHGTDYILS